jgi:alpha-tubulin suppressor-like RCC1 family protein
MRTQRGLLVGGALSLMIGMIGSAVPAAALPPPVGPVRPGGPMVVSSALAWGSNRVGQVGDGTIGGRQALPVRPFGLGSGVSQVAAGQEFTLAVQNGTVLAWGTNTDGQLGDGTLEGHLIPRPVSTLTNVTKVSAGLAHSLALRSDGTVWAWGDNSKGQLGNGTQSDRRQPVPVSILTGVTDISAGDRFSLARRSDGTVWAWGDNSSGALGDGTLTDRLQPVKVPALTNVVQVAAGAAHSMAVRSDGVAFGWGSNTAGQLGDGTLNSRVVPGRVSLLTGVTQIAAGEANTLALSNGRPHWWGRGCGECGYSDPPLLHSVDLTLVVRIATGRYHSLAVRSDGTVWSWGDNYSGQLGDGTTTHRRDPVPVPAASGSVQMDAGGNHTIVVVERPLVIDP